MITLRFYFAAFRRRSGSCGTNADEDRASPYYIKKARYSFTEEQKNLLRQAFQNDPYPTSAAIEKLANRMELSSKTVINWFHNHRMRSKQQTRDENGRRVPGVYIKQEADSNSVDGSQFPSQNSYTSDSQKSSPCSITASPDSTYPTSPKSLSASGDKTLNSSLTSAQLSTGRKRKSANPKYVSQGAVLDKHSNNDETEKEDLEPEIDVTGDSDPLPPLEVDDPDVDCSKAKIAKLEQRVQENDLQWDEEDKVDRHECLQKLESRVNESSNNEWAF